MIVLAVLLCTLGTLVNGDYPAMADLGLHHTEGMQADSRLLLNPFSVFGNPVCEYQGNRGTCYGEVECLALAGNYGNFCPGLQGLCCLFHRTCGQRTSQQESYFKNVQYPLKDQAPTACSFRIVKRSDEFCGVRVNMEEADLPAKRGGSCEEAYFHVTGIHNNRLEPKCGRLTGREYSYGTSNVDELYVHINSTRSSSLAWKIRVTQVKCSEWEGEYYEDEETDSGGASGGGTGGGSGSGGGFGPGSGITTGGFITPPVFPPTFPPSVIGPPAPPTTTTRRPTVTQAPTTGSFSRCGVKGPGFGQGTRGSSEGRRMRLEGPYGPEMSAFMGRRRKNPNRKRPDFLPDQVSTKVDKRQRPGIRPAGPPNAGVDVDGSIASGGVITTLEWGVPSLNDTLFAHYAGEPSLFHTRITYGRVAGTREFPWQIAMTINGKFHCGASLISNYHVLTAAHCVISYKNSPSLVKLSLGDWDLSTSNDGPHKRATVSRVTVHPSYSRATLQNDVAVLKLSERVEYTERIRPICLPPANLNVEGQQAIVTGWGRNEDRRLQTQLHFLRATVVSNTQCDQNWNSNGAARGFIIGSMMCMDSASGDSCNGDSGGPSVYEYPSGSGTYVQVGIVSFGSGSCTDASLPGVYTRVSQYIDWIRQHMN